MERVRSCVSSSVVRPRLRTLLAIGVAVALAGCHCLRRFPDGPAACTDAPSAVVVDASRHALSLCEHGRAVAWWSVRLGWNGTGKQREGDRRTPSGLYPLGAPRPSARYGTFVPIGYPTPAERSAGYTGSAVGVHGPSRPVAWLGGLVNAVDTTDGCVGLARDDDMRALAAWVSAHPGAPIVIR